MATAIISIPNVEGRASYIQRVRLDGRDYTFHVKWNQREGRWYLDLHDDEDAPLISSIKIVSNWPFFRYYKANPAVPPGELFAQDATGDGSPPGFDELGIGKRVELVYFAAVET